MLIRAFSRYFLLFEEQKQWHFLTTIEAMGDNFCVGETIARHYPVRDKICVGRYAARA